MDFLICSKSQEVPFSAQIRLFYIKNERIINLLISIFALLLRDAFEKNERFLPWIASSEMIIYQLAISQEKIITGLMCNNSYANIHIHVCEK